MLKCLWAPQAEMTWVIKITALQEVRHSQEFVVTKEWCQSSWLYCYFPQCFDLIELKGPLCSDDNWFFGLNGVFDAFCGCLMSTITGRISARIWNQDEFWIPDGARDNVKCVETNILDMDCGQAEFPIESRTAGQLWENEQHVVEGQAFVPQECTMPWWVHQHYKRPKPFAGALLQEFVRGTNILGEWHKCLVAENTAVTNRNEWIGDPIWSGREMYLIFISNNIITIDPLCQSPVFQVENIFFSFISDSCFSQIMKVDKIVQ